MELLKIVIIFFLVMWSIYKMLMFNLSYEPQVLKNRGNSGEYIVSCILNELDENYNVENDIHISHTQIDHTVTKNKTIIVIETKNWRGRITGKKNDEKWKQVNHGDESWFKNPIKQNEHHIQKLSEIYPGYNMINLVVFVKNKNVPRLKNVISEDDLFDFIVNFPV